MFYLVLFIALSIIVFVVILAMAKSAKKGDFANKIIDNDDIRN